MWTEIKALTQSLCEAVKLFLTKASSRKFLAFMIATHMVYFEFLEGEDWLMMALVYIGVQGALDWRTNMTGQKLIAVPEQQQQQQEAKVVHRIPSMDDIPSV